MMKQFLGMLSVALQMIHVHGQPRQVFAVDMQPFTSQAATQPGYIAASIPADTGALVTVCGDMTSPPWGLPFVKHFSDKVQKHSVSTFFSVSHYCFPPALICQCSLYFFLLDDWYVFTM